MPSHNDSTPNGRHGRSPKRTMACALVACATIMSAACSGFCENHKAKPARHEARAQTRTQAPRSTPAKPFAAATRDASSSLERYALDKPLLVARLPSTLREVSGLTAISGTEVACIQDEDGLVFVYDLEQQKVTRQVRFGPVGDYEGIARVDARFYVLRSDGTLYELDSLAEQPNVRTHALKLPTSNNEGLCYDSAERRLLIAPKSRMGKGREFKNARPIYAFNLETSELVTDPVIMIDVDSIYQFADAHQLGVPEKAKKKGGTRPMLRFMPSSVAVHPVTGELFLLSAMDHVLATFDKQGQVTGYVVLDSGVFRQPEGVTFLPNGDMVVSNEGAGQEPTLLRFQYQGVQP
ncbi:MAG: hypothetical protein JW940_20095 [Polyangiaceae bacterium]|nr:hypothetical protein [Polyangiaceae bacterium]